MVNSSRLFFYFVHVTLVASSMFINPASCDQTTQALIDNICRQMEEYAFCNNTFNQHLKGPIADITALTQITVEETLSSATDTNNVIRGLLDKATEPAEKNALIVCENAYHLVMDNFQQATSAFFEKDYDSMLTYEKLSPRAQASCTTIFNTPPNPPNPIAEKNTQGRILIAMAVAAGTELISGKS